MHDAPHILRSDLQKIADVTNAFSKWPLVDEEDLRNLRA